MNESLIVISSDRVEGCILYSALIANPGTGKSKSIGLFEKAIKEIDEFLEIDDDRIGLIKSMYILFFFCYLYFEVLMIINFNAAATVEALIETLRKQNCLLSLYDEGSMWFGQQGRYTNGGAIYDRSIYLDLYNCKRSFKRETELINPRFNLCLLGHSHFFIKAIKDEADNRCDGSLQRFLMCCPQKSIPISLKELNE